MSARVLFKDVQLAANIDASNTTTSNRGNGMDSVTILAPKIFTIIEGMSAIVIGREGSNGSAVLYAENGVDIAATASIAANTASRVGPFKGTRQMFLNCNAGVLDVFIEDAVLVAGQCTVYGTGKTGSISFAIPGTGYAFTTGQWYRDGVAIQGETSLTHLQVLADEDKKIDFTPTNPTYRSNYVKGVPAVITLPSQPAKPVLTAIAGGVSLAWFAGASNGSPIDSNQAMDINGNAIALTSNPQTILGLAQVPYTLTVRSHNSLGYGVYSAQADTVTPLSAADVTKPTLLTVSVANSTPTRIDFDFSEPLDTSLALVAANFTVSGHGAVSAPVYSSTTRVSVTVATAVANADVFTAGIAANQIRDLASTPNYLDTVVGRSVTNNVAVVGDTTKPTLLTVSVANSTPNRVDYDFSEVLDTSKVLVASDFTPTGHGAVSAPVYGSNTRVSVTIASPFINGDVATTGVVAGAVRDPALNTINAVTGRAITNNVVATTVSQSRAMGSAALGSVAL